MTPTFALSLSFDGLRLMHRAGAGWTLVGEVALDDPDLTGALARLRAAAVRLEPGGMATKLLLPEAQIRYLALDGTDTDADAVRAALDGATPYALDDLVHDYSKGGGRTYIAAVARETLDEAEAFALEHGFNPVSFAAVPDPFNFVGEPFFGPTRAAGDVEIIRDTEPVVVVGRAAVDPGADAPEAGGPDRAGDAAAGPAEEDEDAAPRGSGTPRAAPPPEGETQAGVEETAAAPSAAAPASGPRQDAAPAPLVARRDSADAGPPPPSFTAGAGSGPVNPPDASRAAPSAEAKAGAPAPDDPGPAAVPAETAPRLSASLTATPAPGPAAAGPDRAPGLFRSRRAPGAQPGADGTMDEGERLTIFGARPAHRKVRRTPRFLGLILTAALILVLLAVAALAALNADTVARWFGWDSGPVQTAAAPPAPPAMDTGEPVAPGAGASAPAPPLSEAAAPATAAPQRPDPGAPAAAPPAVQTATPAAPRDETPEDSAPATPEAAEVAAPAPPRPASSGTVLSPAKAQRLHDTTGVWQRAPRLSDSPRGQALDPVAVAEAFAPPGRRVPGGLPGGPAPDAVIARPLNPPAPDATFDFGPDGHVVATPEGARTPDGILAFAGTPPLSPPPRPGTEPPERTVVDQLAGVIPQAASTGADPEAGVVIIAGAPRLAPPVRPGTEPPAADPGRQGAEGLDVVAGVPPLSPPVRPAPPAADQAGPLELVAGAPPLTPPARPGEITARAAPGAAGELGALTAEEAADLRPRPRPDALVPAAPETPEPDEEDEASLTLSNEIAAAVQAAAARPDPFADATDQAPRASLRPGPRPGDFDRVVANAQPAPAVAEPARPSGPTTASVARAATEEGAINLRRVNLIGVYGSSDDRSALVRLSNGQLTRVTVGDRLDGGRVQAIGSSALIYAKRGRQVRLEVGG